MRKVIIGTIMGFALASLVGCSPSTNATTASNSPQTQTNQPSASKSQHRGGQLNNQELLSLLKIDSKTLQEDFKAGKSLADIATEKGLKEQQVIDLLIKQSSEKTDAAVKSGKLTQDKADQMKAKQQNRIKQEVEHKGGMGNFGGRQEGQRHAQNTSASNSQTN